MSIESALEFIKFLREGEDLQKQILADNQCIALDRLVLFASQAGYSFSADELITAHKHDWAIRWWEYNRA